VTAARETVLPQGLPAPAPLPDGLDRPYWEATKRHELVAQRCSACGRFQWGPEWICHRCHSFDVGWARVPGPARIFSWERAWHPVHPALRDAVPYVVLLVEFPEADGIRMIGNLAGDPRAAIEIGARVEPVFEDHGAYTLVQWRTT
jgi:uncharacterized OB-fold protein